MRKDKAKSEALDLDTYARTVLDTDWAPRDLDGLPDDLYSIVHKSEHAVMSMLLTSIPDLDEIDGKMGSPTNRRRVLAHEAIDRIHARRNRELDDEKMRHQSNLVQAVVAISAAYHSTDADHRTADRQAVLEAIREFAGFDEVESDALGRVATQLFNARMVSDTLPSETEVDQSEDILAG